jgi:5-oxoprolinase (ATP-hydrolysing) subunit A
VVGLVTAGSLPTAAGGQVRVLARSVCVHGDTPGAVSLARSVRAALEEAGAELAPFA